MHLPFHLRWPVRDWPDPSKAGDIAVSGQIFERPGKDGDFLWMITQDKYRDVLFVFNDNEDQYKAHRDNPKADEGCSEGGGNAIIRPFQCLTPPRAAGVPTGPDYERLTPDVKKILDEAINSIENIANSEHYKRIMYSAANANGDLGTRIFNPGDDVKKYIVERLRAIQTR
jgi:hypothetical protein